MNNKKYLEQANFRLYVLSAYVGGVEVSAKQAAGKMAGLIEALDKTGIHQRKGKARNG